MSFYQNNKKNVEYREATVQLHHWKFSHHTTKFILHIRKKLIKCRELFIFRCSNLFVEELTVSLDLPQLVVSMVPLPEHNVGAVLNTFVAVKSINVQANVIDHSDCSVAFSEILAHRPQHRFVIGIWIIRHQLHLRTIFSFSRKIYKNENWRWHGGINDWEKKKKNFREILTCCRSPLACFMARLVALLMREKPGKPSSSFLLRPNLSSLYQCYKKNTKTEPLLITFMDCMQAGLGQSLG